MEADAGLSRRLWATLVRFLLLYVPVALVLTLTIYLFYRLEADNERKMLKSEQFHQVQLEKEALAGILEDAEVEAQTQAQHNLLERLQGPPSSAVLDDLAHELGKVLQTTRAYRRILYLDRHGRTQEHLEREDDRARVVRKVPPRDFSSQPWVARALRLPRNQVYISSLRQQEDEGAIIRVAAPVINRWGEREGLVVMDYQASQALRKMAGLYFSQGMALLLDQQGHILLGGRYQGNPPIKPSVRSDSFAQIWPQMWQQVAKQDQGQVFAPAGLFTWATVAPPLASQGQSWWKLVSLVPAERVDMAVGVYLVQLTQLLTVVLFVAGLICWFLAWSQIRHRLAQEALTESEQRLQDIMSFSPTMIYLKDHAGRYNFVNRRFERLLGVKPDEALGRSDEDLFPEATAQALRHHDRDVLMGRGPLHSEERIPLDDGVHTYLSAKFPLRDPMGRIYGVGGISTDITELKSTQAELKRAKEAAEGANRQLRVKQARLDEDIKAAAGIQRTLLPYNLPHLPQVELAWKFVPSEVIGGDLFHAQPLGPDHLCLYMLDVSGHGVPAALVTVSVHETLDPASGHVAQRDPNGAMRGLPPSKVLSILDREYPLERFDKSFSIVYLLLRLSDGEVVYSSAGHPPPIVLRTSGEMEELTAGGTLIGLDGVVPFEDGHSVLRPGDKLLLYTDGVVEYSNHRGQLFGVERLRRLLREKAALPVGELMESLWRELMAYGQNHPPSDDVSLMGLQYRGPGLKL